jgi:hypothetical protein
MHLNSPMMLVERRCIFAASEPNGRTNTRGTIFNVQGNGVCTFLVVFFNRPVSASACPNASLCDRNRSAPCHGSWLAASRHAHEATGPDLPQQRSAPLRRPASAAISGRPWKPSGMRGHSPSSDALHRPHGSAAAAGAFPWAGHVSFANVAQQHECRGLDSLFGIPYLGFVMQ